MVDLALRRRLFKLLVLTFILRLAFSNASSVVAWASDTEEAAFAQARQNGARFDEMARAAQRLLKAWLKHADARTSLLPERLPGERGLKPGDHNRRYTPHNSGADLYPYLILTAHLTDPELYRGKLLEMLRNEVRYTTRTDSIPGNLDLNTGELGPTSFFGAGEYAKDGLLAVTELLGRTPWFYRMVDMTADVMKNAPVPSRFGNLPASDSELNGDLLQTLVRLGPMTGDPRFIEWARRIADAYVEEVLPANEGLPCLKWNFNTHTGDGQVRLRDHGNEVVVGLVLVYALERRLDPARAARYRPVLARMLDRILASANPDGMRDGWPSRFRHRVATPDFGENTIEARQTYPRCASAVGSPVRRTWVGRPLHPCALVLCLRRCEPKV